MGISDWPECVVCSTHVGQNHQLQLWAGLFQLQLLDSCEQHVAFIRRGKFLGFMVKNQDVKSQIQSPRN